MAARSYAQGVATTPLLGETIGESFERTVAKHPGREALVVRHQDVRLTYAELNQQVDQLARALLASGLEKGDRLGIWAPNCVEWVLVQFASAKAGVILVNVNPAYRTSELEYALDQSGCRMLIAAREFKGSDYVAMVEEVQPRLAELERVVHLESDSWDGLLASGDGDLAARQAELDFDDPINIQYTSGTTGFPKGATLSHHNILNNGFFVARACRYTEEDRVCIPVPFYHCFGMVMGNLAATSHGAAMVIPAPAFDPAATLSAVAAERCTSLYG
ncbi:MAG: fatty-acyl-CoA synthase, partial [Thermoleophilaceae bacterium]|nr:fatty-acyl-CoA synthase [Thermoleophilaceae bacterium]